MRTVVSVGSLEGQEEQRSGKTTTPPPQVIKKLHNSWETTVYDLDCLPKWSECPESDANLCLSFIQDLDCHWWKGIMVPSSRLFSKFPASASHWQITNWIYVWQEMLPAESPCHAGESLEMVGSIAGWILGSFLQKVEGWCNWNRWRSFPLEYMTEGKVERRKKAWGVLKEEQGVLECIASWEI